MDIRIALAGNPNCGKTTMFNDLTGSTQYVGNWPGVTVEKKEGRLKGHKNVIIQDLPGIYSLSPYTPEELVARGYLVGEKPDAIINIVDGTNIERNLYLTTQLIELGVPVVIAVNMIDLVRKNGDEIDLEKLGEALGCAVMETSALKCEGSLAVAEAAVALVKSGRGACEPPPVFSGSVEHAVAHIEESIEKMVEPRLLRWYAIKLFERDEQVVRELNVGAELMAHIDDHIADCEKELDDDAESIIIDQRYGYITGVVKKAVRKKRGGRKLSASDRIDRIVTDRFLALPIFALVMTLVYYISITTIGSLVTDWTNNTLFGELICGNLSVWFARIGVAPWLTGLVIDGMIGGVGAVIGFVPQMLILFFMLSLLEDVGYMARVAFIMDKLFRRFGLSGKSFIPMLIGSGCSVPGIMASRTIESERDRRMTIMTTAFIPCGAKMPIIALFAGALFGGSGLIATSAYFIGVAAVAVSGIILKQTKPFRGEAAPFIMELPEYHVPAMSNVLRFTWERGLSFIKKAGTIILAASIILWFFQAFGFQDGAFRMITDNDKSLLAAVGGFIAPIFAPLGFGNWKAAVATLAGLTAKENVVSTLAVLYGFAGNAGGGATWGALTADFTRLTAYSFMLFNLLCAPCFAAMGAIRREMNSTKWTLAAIGYMTGFAYVVSFLVYQLGTLAVRTSATARVAAVVFAIFAAVVWKLVRDRKKRKNGICTGACAGCPRAGTCGKKTG